MPIVKGAGKKASTDQGPPKVRAATSPPKRAGPVSATLGPAGLQTSGPASSDTAWEDFDESAYLVAFPDVARSIKDGQFPSALRHYESNGRHEGRLTDPRYEAAVRADTTGFPAASVDGIYGCKDGQ